MSKKKSTLSRWVKKIKKGEIHPLFKNRYFVTPMILLFWMVFFDHNSVISQLKLRYEIWDQNRKIEYYQVQLKEIEKEKGELFGSPESLEKFAREKYKMKKDNEDLFVVVDGDKK